MGQGYSAHGAIALSGRSLPGGGEAGGRGLDPGELGFSGWGREQARGILWWLDGEDDEGHDAEVEDAGGEVDRRD